jgi:hypothetical protein
VVGRLAIAAHRRVRHHTLSNEDLAVVAGKRGDHNRVGFALTLCYLRFRGRALGIGETPPLPLIRLEKKKVARPSVRGSGEKANLARTRLRGSEAGAIRRCRSTAAATGSGAGAGKASQASLAAPRELGRTRRERACLSSTLANLPSPLAARNAEHRIVLDDFVGALEHKFHAAEVAEGAPAIVDVGPIKQLEAIGVRDGAQPCDGI